MGDESREGGGEWVEIPQGSTCHTECFSFKCNVKLLTEFKQGRDDTDIIFLKDHHVHTLCENGLGRGQEPWLIQKSKSKT